MVLPIALLTTQLAFGGSSPNPAIYPKSTSKAFSRQKINRLFEAMESSSRSIAEKSKPGEVTFGIGMMSDNSQGRLNATDIPFLLERVDNKNWLRSFPTNSISSCLTEKCSEGMIALWFIEGIRRGSQFPSLNPLCYNVNRVHSNANREALSESNHSIVARAYRSWWKNAHGDLSTAVKIDPLAETGLTWN